MSLFPDSHCTLCGTQAPHFTRFRGNLDPNKVRPQSFSPRVLKGKAHFDFQECGDCGILFPSPLLPESVLKELYSDSSMENETLLEEEYTELEKFIYQSYQPILDIALRRTQSRNSFVEVGGGSGFMLRYAVERGFQEQIELELSEAALKRFQSPSEKAKFYRQTLEESSLHSNSVSVISFFQMLDHVADPRFFLSQVLDRLEPGGVAVCVVHDTSALPTRILGARSPILNVCHNYLFNPKNLSRLFEQVGFQEITAFPIANQYPIWYWLYLLPLPTKLKSFLNGVLNFTKCNSLPIRLFAGNFCVIASKEP